ncbi:hypothetical protein [uncultured Massilia sp.]|uniref:hypothetical protein n=1 Tax=uncultured Massilia sp. TaxID=169973 RepID=UPI0025ECDFD3|nr:hypothetical protein [uncultured Massilia sp.]
MKTSIVLSLALASSAACAQWGDRATTTQECTRRCIAAEAPNALLSRYDRRLERLRERRQSASGPKMLEALAREEAAILGERREAREALCRKACSDNPDE